MSAMGASWERAGGRLLATISRWFAAARDIWRPAPRTEAVDCPQIRFWREEFLSQPKWYLPRPRSNPFVVSSRVAVKALHSLAVLIFAAAAGYLIYCGVTGTRDALMVWGLVAVAVEATIYVGFGGKCPLTMLARWLGDEGGHDYLFEWLLGTKRIWLVSRSLAALAGVGVLLIIVRGAVDFLR